MLGHGLPVFAARFIFRTLTHSAMAAPELSITLSMVWRKELVSISYITTVFYLARFRKDT